MPRSAQWAGIQRVAKKAHRLRCAVVLGLTAQVVVVFPAPLASATDGSKGIACSASALIRAINVANASPGADTLRLAPRCTYRLLADPGTGNGLPAITSQVTIQGRGAVIRRDPAAPPFRVLFVSDGGDLTLSRTTIEGGIAIDCPNEGVGVCGGGISSLGKLTVNNSRVRANKVASDVAVAAGGGIATGGDDGVGTAVLVDTEISGNDVAYEGSTAGFAVGGGLFSNGPVTVSRSRIFKNRVRVSADTQSSAFGSGYAAFASATVKKTIISQNRSDAPGGDAAGALTNGATEPTKMMVIDTVIRNNTVSAPRGEAVGGAVATPGLISLRGVEIVGNEVAALEGGTAYSGGVHIGQPVTVVTIEGSIIHNNAARTSGGGSARGGGVGNANGGTVSITRSRLEGNEVTAGGVGVAQGGGIFTATGTTSVFQSTVSRNRADDGGGIYKESGTVSLEDSGVKQNVPNNCAPPGSVPGCFG
ncbi:hypothetical protein [Streptomyces sp. NPDC127084]|uniref:hypothetical protein n=1 Tax=Streptomyces sp. NPDC127084 TaxID=3347133 RepID=UPI0036570B08